MLINIIMLAKSKLIETYKITIKLNRKESGKVIDFEETSRKLDNLKTKLTEIGDSL